MSKFEKEITVASRKAQKLMNKEQVAECNKIIHTASAACAVIGAVPIPIADSIPITALQVTMAFKLGKVFGKEIGSAAAKTMIAAFAAPLIGRAGAKIVFSFIPVLGWGANAAVAAAVTEAVGWSIAGSFAADVRKAAVQENFDINDYLNDVEEEE